MTSTFKCCGEERNWARGHAADCPLYGHPVGSARQNLERHERHSAENRRTGLYAVPDGPVLPITGADADRCPAHASEPADTCEPCCEEADRS